MYADFYGLRGEPFLLTPDQRFYFDLSVHAQAMAHLTYGLSRGEEFIVITGEVGAGKTTLVKRLCSSLDEHEIVAAHVVTTMLDGADLLRMVASAFGLRDLPSEKSALLMVLLRFFKSSYRARRRVLLIVDEAQNLSIGAVEELRMLSNFQVEQAAPFQSFLLGQPEFRQMLMLPELEQLRQRVIVSYHLGPMSCEECGAYLSHRLTQVGWHNDPDFDSAAIEAIYVHSGGIPRRNTICSRLMLLGFLDELHHFSGTDVERVVADLAAEGYALRDADSPSHAALPTPAAAGATIDPSQLAERFDRIERILSATTKPFGGQCAWRMVFSGFWPDGAGNCQTRTRNSDERDHGPPFPAISRCHHC